MDFETLCASVGNRELPYKITTFVNNENLYIQSMDYLHPSAVPRFLLTIRPDRTFDGYHAGIKTSIVPLSRNRITKIV